MSILLTILSALAVLIVGVIIGGVLVLWAVKSTLDDILLDKGIN